MTKSSMNCALSEYSTQKTTFKILWFGNIMRNSNSRKWNFLPNHTISIWIIRVIIGGNSKTKKTVMRLCIPSPDTHRRRKHHDHRVPRHNDNQMPQHTIYHPQNVHQVQVVCDCTTGKFHTHGSHTLVKDFCSVYKDPLLYTSKRHQRSVIHEIQ